MSVIESDVRIPGLPPLSDDVKRLIAAQSAAAEACALKMARDYPAWIDGNNTNQMFCIRAAFLEGVGFGVRVTP